MAANQWHGVINNQAYQWMAASCQLWLINIINIGWPMSYQCNLAYLAWRLWRKAFLALLFLSS